jgi:hypothetical protein
MLLGWNATGRKAWEGGRGGSPESEDLPSAAHQTPSRKEELCFTGGCPFSRRS